MFDFAWSELALIAVIALVVIGPKDLPRVMRIVGQWTRRARAIAREFQGSLDQMVREAELDEVKKHMDRASSFDVENEIRRVVDPTGEVQRSLSEPVLANPLADPPKPVETTPLPSPVLEGRIEMPAATPAEPAAAETMPAETTPAETTGAEAKPAASEPEKHAP